MNPGATTLPAASIVRAVWGADSSVASRRIRSPLTATVPCRPGAPVPSTIVPPRIRISTLSATVLTHGRVSDHDWSSTMLPSGSVT